MPGNLHWESIEMIPKAPLAAWTITPEIEKLTLTFESQNEAEPREEPTKLMDENCVKNEPKIFPSKVDTTEASDEPKIMCYQSNKDERVESTTTAALKKPENA
eukprot:14053742-Ditylum_brightwellii.AAC.1